MTKSKASYRELRRRARRMRSNMTTAEVRLWSELRRKQLDGYKFRRQHVMTPYIVDFYCLSEKLVVEVDGVEHERPERQESDAKRDEFLREEYGVEVLRVPASDVFADLEGVLQRIREWLENG